MITKNGESAQKGRPALGIVVAFSGKAKSGKDTAADILVEEFGFRKFAFANAVKRFAMQYFDLTREEVYESKTVFSRRILQGLGTFTRKEIQESYWIDMLRDDIRRYVGLNHAARVVISDVRTLEEARLVSELRGRLIRVTRQGGMMIECGLNHISETELDNYHLWDYEVCNNSDLDSYRSRVREMVTKWI